MDAGALFVLLLCGAIGCGGLHLVRDTRERERLIRMFMVAFGLRVVFTVLCYQSGVINLLGGMDDSAWISFWYRSVHWQAVGPDPLMSLYEPRSIQANQGYAYLSTYFYYLLNVRSQIALSFLNCFINAVTVLIIYRAAREFYSQKASNVVATVATYMPSYLIWSALSIKETWVIFFQIATFFGVWQMMRSRSAMQKLCYLLLIVTSIALTLSFRFYAARFLLVATLVTLICSRSRRPLAALFASLISLSVMLLILNAVHLLRVDWAQFTADTLHDLDYFRTSISDPRFGGRSSVRLDYDTTTWSGAAMMLLVGSLYMLLSPFPWEIRTLSQMLTLPDLLIWWWVVFYLVVPGIPSSWRRHSSVTLSVLLFIVPLTLFYAFMFGNVGLAYRQRAQLIPFFLILAAAGYDARHRRTEDTKRLKFARVLAKHLRTQAANPSLLTSPALSLPKGSLSDRSAQSRNL